MSIIADPQSPIIAPPAGDPYYYGWRDEEVAQPDGTTKFRRVALTLEDYLHPQEGDVFMEAPTHDLWRSYLRDGCRIQLQADPSALVISNSELIWDDPELGHHAPDVGVVFGVRQPRVFNQPFRVAEEGVRPALLIEVVSPRYRENDVVTKIEAYHRAGVPTYVILDKVREEDPWTIRGFQRGRQRYVPMALDERGRLWLQAVDLWLAVDGQHIFLYEDGATQPIGDPVGLWNQLRETLAQVKAEMERADAEKNRANAAEARANAEKAGRDAAEARIRELEALLAKQP